MAWKRQSPGRWPARFSLHRLERQHPTLENIFLRYVRETAAGGAGGDEGRAGRLPEGAGDLFPLADRLLRGGGLPARNGLLLPVQHLPDRRRHNGRDAPEHGGPPGIGDSRALDAAVLGRTGSGHDGVAADAPPRALADRPGQVSRGRHHAAPDHRRHADQPDPALPVRHSRDADHPLRLPRLPAAGHGLPGRRPALLGLDAEPDRGRSDHRRLSARLLVRRSPAGVPECERPSSSTS